MYQSLPYSNSSLLQTIELIPIGVLPLTAVLLALFRTELAAKFTDVIHLGRTLACSRFRGLVLLVVVPLLVVAPRFDFPFLLPAPL